MYVFELIFTLCWKSQSHLIADDNIINNRLHVYDQTKPRRFFALKLSDLTNRKFRCD